MRANGWRRTRDRPQQVSERHRRVQPRSANRHRRTRHRARRVKRLAASARPVVPGRCQHLGAVHPRRHGGQQLVRLALDRVRQHGAQRSSDRCPALGRHRSVVRPGSRNVGWLAAHPQAARRSARHRCARVGPDRAPCSEGDAPRRRLQRRHLLAAERAPIHRRWQRQYRASAGGQRRYACMDQRADAAACAAAGASHIGRRQLPDAVSGDAVRAAHRQARPVCGRAGRSHDDRAFAQQPRVPSGDRSRADRRARSDSAGRVQRRRCADIAAQARRPCHTDRRSRTAESSRSHHRRRCAEGIVGSAQGRAQHHDEHARRRQAGVVHRRLRSTARTSGRVRCSPNRCVCEARHARHLVRTCIGRHLARASDPGHAPDRGELARKRCARLPKKRH